MTFILTKAKLAIAILTVALLVPATAFATHSWSDVPDGEFYHDAVAWAKANGMTVGCEGTTAFCPERNVTRGENITFAHRYDDLVVQPALTTLTGTAAANSAAIVGNDTDIAAMTTVHWARVSIAGAVEATGSGVTAVEAGTGFFDVTFPEPVGSCAIHTTLSARSSTVPLVIIGLAFAAEGYAVVSDNTSSDDGTVRVHTYIHSAASAGTLAVATSLPFSVMATC